jgi:hypothetical protein
MCKCFTFLHMYKYVRLVMIYEIVNVRHLHMYKYVRLVMIYEIVNVKHLHMYKYDIDYFIDHYKSNIFIHV